MAWLLTGIGILVVLLILGRAFVAADPRALVRLLRYIIGLVMMGFGLLLIIGRRWELGLPLVVMGFSAITLGRIGPFDLGGGGLAGGGTSSVRSHYFDMNLNHETGAMSGRVMGGSFEGRKLDDLDEADLRLLYREVSSDPESLALLEAYLDRRLPGWREDVEGDGAAGTAGAADPGPMADEQAYEILGLAPGASEAEIRAAHRNLMKGVHPDQGGSTFLAAKINEAKDRLLGKRHR